jgi:hypothetical protein
MGSYSKGEIPEGRRCVKSKWELKIKRNGIFRARFGSVGAVNCLA